jgi:putative tryptophan/tyrosine transport system substrate-binding protein
MNRRGFIALFGSTVAWPLAARAQQPAMPVIGFLGVSFFGPERLTAFRHGLADAGLVEGKNVTVEYRWAEGQYDRLAELARDLVRRQVAVIAAASAPAALAAKSATTTIPIVFVVGDDPVKIGLVASLSRPAGNATGINFFTGELVPKRLGLLRELLPGATRLAVLVNPTDRSLAEPMGLEIEAAARVLQLELQVINAATSREIDEAFATLGRERPDALFVGPDPFFNRRRVQLAISAARYGIPTTYPVREYAEAGGLMSYGTNINDAYRQVALYAGNILKGAKPADIPVVQSTKFELVINLQTARTLGLEVPATLLARADEVIE